MPTPTLITDLSTTAASNFPASSDSPSVLDDVQRAHAAFIAQIRDAVPVSSGGNLTFTGTGNRIKGDFSNATTANRVMFQTSTVNGATNLHAIPNGAVSTGQSASGVKLEDSTSISAGNGAYVSLDLIQSTEARLASVVRGTGTYLPMTFYTNNSERFRINTTGAWGIGGANYGTAGQVLKSNGDAPPTWGSAASVQIQPISASVASNAITISASALSLDFRSTTLTSSTVTTVTGTPANLVIAATDSFGAVTAAGTQRIAILAINNAGTIELAASNLSGGVSLDETGVITTATIATTATAIKAGAVRTGVAYRVVGFIDVPFTTAVGWGAIVLKQGYGGQALAAMSSLGYGQTWQSVTRTSGTTYHNTTGRPIIIKVEGTGGSNTNVSVSIAINGVAVGLMVQTSAGVGTPSFVGSMIIPPNCTYLLGYTNVVSASFYELR